MKPCYFCGRPAPNTFDAKSVFDTWASDNGIIASCRSRFDGIRDRLSWAALDETDKGAHPECALKWAIDAEDFGTRYPIIPTLTVGASHE